MGNIPIGLAATNVTADGFEFYAVCKAIHCDGSTETVLATGTSKAINTAIIIKTDGKSFASTTAICIMDVATNKHFKAGEILRFTVEGWFKSTDGNIAAAHLIIGHDPQNRNANKSVNADNVLDEIELANEQRGGGTITYLATQMNFQVPFRLNL